MIKKCPECAEQLTAADKFCFECGYEFSENVEETVAYETGPNCVTVEVDSQAIACEAVLKTGVSDCPDFLVEFNQGSSVFMTGSISSFQFRVTPVSERALEAEEIQLSLQYPDGTQSVVRHVQPFQFKRTQLALVNYRASLQSEGFEQVVEFFFSFTRGNKRFHYTQQLLVDVYAKDESPAKIFDNLTLKVDNIHFEGATHAGDQRDQRIALIENLQQSKNSGAEMMSQIKQAESWTPLALFLCGKVRDKVQVPLPPQPQQKLTLTTSDGFLLHLYSGSIRLGRNKACELCARNLPAPGDTPWSQAELIRRNQSISGTHCTVSITDKMVGVQDLSSANGTFLNGRTVGKTVVSLVADERLHLSLASADMNPCNFDLTAVVFECKPHQGIPDVVSLGESVTGALVMNRLDAVKERYVLINRGVSMNLIVPGGRGEWWLCRRDGAFGLTDGQTWYWLVDGVKLPTASGIVEVASQFGQYLG